MGTMRSTWVERETDRADGDHAINLGGQGERETCNNYSGTDLEHLRNEHK